MKQYRASVFLILFILEICDEVNGGCNLSLKNDFASPSPVYIHNGGFLAPNTASGDILLRRSETLEVACPGNKKSIVLANITTEFNVLTIKCVNNSIFRDTKSPWVGTIKDIKCNEQPWFTAEETDAVCYGGNKMYRIGFKTGNKFYTLYEACFDKYLLHTLYVKHELRPESKFLQGGARPNFIEGDVFGKVRMSRLFKKEHQKNRLREILGEGMVDEYITKSEFLNRGHLAPRADFSLRAEQRASFHYINTAPQWMRGNAGDWAALEDALRRRVHANRRSVTVYTGTYGVCTLADGTYSSKEIYLDVDSNNNGIVPVPLYFYKVVYDPAKQTAAAFISINSPYYNRTMIEKLAFCSDICERNAQYAWLKWRPKDGTHSFCCTYEDFVKGIDNLPKLNVKGPFY